MINPIAFSVFGIDVRWYGIIITMGILISGYIAILNGKKINISEDDIIDYIMIALPFAIMGARLYYVAFEWDFYKGDLLKILNIRQGGLAIHGGIIASIIVGYLYTKYKKIDFLKFFDLIFVSLPLGQSIGRWGNFTNSEAHGGPTDLPWAITVEGAKVHPTFLYESIWNLILFFILLKIFKNKKFNGQIISIYLIIYSIGRFWIEGLRTDSLMFFGLRIAQIISLILIIIGIFLYFYCNKNKEISGEI